MQPFPGIDHGDALKLLVTFAVLLASARLLGEGARRLSLPPVVGEISAGVLLGPSALASVVPLVERWVVPGTPTEAHLLDLVGLLGILLMMVVVGLETDLGMIRARASTALGVAVGGLVVPIVCGLALGMLIPDDLLPTGNRSAFSMFLAIALALSAIPVLARILIDLDLLRRDFGQVLLAAGMIDDILGWALLGVAASLADAGSISLLSVGVTVGSLAIVLGATVIVLRPLLRSALGFVQDRFLSRDRLLTLVVVAALGWGAVTQALHLEALLGAFAVGLVFGQMRRLPVEVGRQLESVTFGVFAPVFLATAGLRLDVGTLTQPRLLGITVGIVAVATFGKVGGAYVGARLVAGTGRWEALAYGCGLNARGVLGIIVAALGLSLGIFSVEVYSMVVVMSVATSIMAPAALRWALSHVPGLEEGAPRPAIEAGVRRVLVPVRPREGPASVVQEVEAAVLSRLGEEGMPAITLLSVADRTKRLAAEYLADVARLYPRRGGVRQKVVEADDPVPPILAEAQNDYDLVVLGTPERELHLGPWLFSSVVDEVVRLAPCPTLVVRADRLPDPWPPNRVLVPVDGSPASQRAVEVAFAIARYEAHVVALHVVVTEDARRLPAGRAATLAGRLGRGQELVDSVRAAGKRLDVDMITDVVLGGDTVDVILERARSDVGLIVVGGIVRAGLQQLFLGPKVERIVREARCPVIVVNGV